MNLSQILATAFSHHQAGDIATAEPMYRQILADDPQNADAWHLLGVAVREQGRHAEAVDLINRALAIQPADAQAWYNLAVVLVVLGRTEEALDAYQRVLVLDPNFVQAVFNLGNLLRDLGRSDEAICAYRQAILLQPEYFKAYNNLGSLLQSQGRLDEALEAFTQALRLKPDYALVKINLGSILRTKDRLDEAIALLREVIATNPNLAEAYNNLGSALQLQRKSSEAVEAFRQALRVRPDYLRAKCNLAAVLLDQEKFDEAMMLCNEVIVADPNCAEAYNTIGAVFTHRRQPKEAIPWIEKAISWSPNYFEAHNNLGVAQMREGRYDAASACFERALAIDPKYVEAHNNLGVTHMRQGQLDTALACFERALTFDPEYSEAHKNSGYALLSQGNFERGWREHEWRLKCKGAECITYPQPKWNGAPMAGTLLLNTEQGFGDTIQFIRFATIARQRASRVVIVCQPQLVNLLAECAGLETVLPYGTAPPPIDAYTSLLSLPPLLRSSAEEFSAPVPYLQARADLVAKWKDRLAPIEGLRIGIAWQGNPDFYDDALRSIPLREFALISQVPGVRLISLQKGFGIEQLTILGEQLSIVDLGPDVDKDSGAFMDTAAIMANLDLVISCDTAVVHLAGALGVPVWLPLTHVPDWRWMLVGDESPWYPSMRLFRQSPSRDWPGVFERMASELNELLDKKATSGAR